MAAILSPLIGETDTGPAVDSDGWLYDPETGEVVGRADVPEAFVVDTQEKAEWVLELRSRIEGDLAGVEARLRAVTQQLEAIRRRHVRRLAWWDWKFSSSLIGFARSCLTGKARTARFGWGSVSFRRTPGTTQICDNAAAVEFVRTWRPELVRVVESVTVKAVAEAKETALRETGEDEPLAFVVRSEPGESVSIVTGIEREER